ncbi:hypothetical protein GIB67_021942 [Kingdonia uniflora]|uniref:Uncharacterized protein n=1 Tax=Kingdonia uniflora TaxID=39325 RepID=A0A7J7MSC1_9MAGN|nr:hypothetical protein GIB67_021942 [Kingdonia uniflora]
MYDNGHREEALAKAEKSISIQRSFEAFFLKAYALVDTNLAPDYLAYVIQLMEEALNPCPYGWYSEKDKYSCLQVGRMEVQGRVNLMLIVLLVSTGRHILYYLPYEMILACLPDSSGHDTFQALNNLGSVYADCGKLDQATDYYMNALNIKHTRAHQGLARIYHLKNKKIEAYNEMTSVTNNLYLIPTILMDNRKVNEAIAELSKNPVELDGLRKAHIRDGAVVGQYLAWQDKQVIRQLQPIPALKLNFYKLKDTTGDDHLSKAAEDD